MALPTITLDDRSFDQLFAFMRKQIDTSEWVDHNFSDPGIVLLDLLCWIGETILYRADRVPDSHIAKFANLIIDPPEPVTVQLTLTANLNLALRTQDLTVPAGTRFATVFTLDATTQRPRRYVFETIEPAIFRTSKSVTVTARECLIVENEALGTSDGTANQTFPFRPVRTDLGLPLDHPVPGLLDFVHRSAAYDPNPQITVAGQPWDLQQFLLTGQSRVDPAHPDATHHFMVDSESLIRFGDGVSGSIPPAGALIVCTRYRVLQGPDALIGAHSPSSPSQGLVHLLDPVPLLAAETIAWTHGEAEGGGSFFQPQERLRQGLERFRRPFRLVTESDFEQVLSVDFNAFQALSGARERVLRAVALMNRKPQAPQQQATGHVTIAVLAQSTNQDPDGTLNTTGLNAPSMTQKQGLVDLAPSLKDKIERFLDKRRLVTTRVHLQSPTLSPVSINATVFVDRDRSIAEMTSGVEQRLRQFLGIIHGGFDRKGWPLGGSVYRSKLFRLIEDMDGVDHVETLTLSPADHNGDIPLDPLSLPALDSLAIAVVRM
jgi:hypothetical protein